MATPVVCKMYEFNKTLIGATVVTARQVASAFGEGVGSAVVAARDAGATVAGQARSATQRTVAQATSGVREVADQARSSTERTVAQATSGFREVTGQARAQGRRASERIETATERTIDRATQAVDPSPSSGTPYEQWTKAELYERAQELDVDGRSSMSKKALIAALRSA